MTPTPAEPPNEGPDEDDAAWHGWIDPEDRLWRHPSELAGRPAAAADAPDPPARHPHRTPLMVLIGVAGAAAALAGTLILLSPGAAHPPRTVSATTADAPLTTLAGPQSDIPTVAVAAGRAMVPLRADTAHGVVDLVGVAVAEGGLVATTGGDLSGLRSLAMVGPNGRLLPASVMAADQSSDIVLVEVPDDLPVAPFSDDVSLSTGSGDMTLSVTGVDRGAPVLHSASGSVTGVGGAITGGPAAGMPDITTSAAAVPHAAGDLLLDSSGAVLGIYYGSGSGGTDAGESSGAPAPPPGTALAYLPSELVLGVADDLRSSGHVTHGWLGISGSDAGPGGAAVAKVATGSPAVGHLAAGDVIAKLGSVPIRSMADLRGRLYVLPPRTKVALSVRRGSALNVVDVTLGASP